MEKDEMKQDKTSSAKTNSYCGTNDWFKQYLKEISVYPLLTPEEEIYYGNLVQKGDKKAREIMINSNYRLVVRFVLRRISIMNQKLPDAIQEGNIGLIQAVDTYNPSLGNRFSTHAFWNIKYLVYEVLYGSDYSFHISRNDSYQIFKIRKKMDEYYQKTGRILSLNDLANELDCPIDKLVALLNVEKDYLSLNQSPTDNPNVTYEEVVCQPDIQSVEEQVIDKICSEERQKIFENVLSDREREILEKRIGLGDYEDNSQTLEQVASSYNITRQRVAEIEKRAKVKLKRQDGF